MSGVLHAFTAFFDHLRAFAWTPVLLALLCQFAWREPPLRSHFSGQTLAAGTG